METSSNKFPETLTIKREPSFIQLPQIVGLQLVPSVTVDLIKLEILLYTLFVHSCPTKLTGLYRTVSIFLFPVPLSLPGFMNQNGVVG